MVRGRTSVAVCLALLALTLPATGAEAAGAKPKLRVLSNRADLISGGQALVSVRRPRGVPRSERPQLVLRKRANGGITNKDVTRRLRRAGKRRRMAKVRGLRLGWNTVIARWGPGPPARARIKNHPHGGPVFAGKQLQPWVCQDTAVDAKCNQRRTFEFVYKPEGGSRFQPYDPGDPPGDVAETTTDQGVTVPFVVRVETGYQDRDQYKIATLFVPGKRWKPWRPQEQWNHKLLITHGQGCGVSYGAGTAPAVYGALQAGIPGVDDAAAAGSDDVGQVALGRGFAVASTALDNNSHNCNIALQAESLVMLKERIVETRGTLRYTIAAGCSGGSVTQQQVANAYPGVYQGLTPQCSYPDTFSPGTQFADYHMLRLYFENPGRWGPGVVWLPTQFAEVEGHLSHLNAITADEGLFKGAINPQNACYGVPGEMRFHPETNPGGVRCDVLTSMVSVLGTRPPSVWSDTERRIGRGYAGVPFGNVGVQYGLGALLDGSILPAQFVDLNARIGGLSLDDLSATPDRLAGDARGLRNAYRSGAFNSANNLDRVPIINLGGPDPGAAHDYAHAYFMRARLEREQGHLGNYVMWFGATPILGDLRFRSQALIAVDRWLGAIEADRRKVPLARKVVEDRPGDIADRCETTGGAPAPPGTCDQPATQTLYGTPRTVAGAGIASDVGACSLKPLRETDYPGVGFTDAQWAALEAAFPDGVCDFSRPGRGQRDTIAWLRYSKRGGDVIKGGGRPMGPAPARSGAGWTSRAFSSWRRGN